MVEFLAEVKERARTDHAVNYASIGQYIGERAIHCVNTLNGMGLSRAVIVLDAIISL